MLLFVTCATAMAQGTTQKVQSLLDANKVDEAEEVLAKNEQSTQEKNRLSGELAIKKEQWGKAESIFNQLMTAHPKNADYHFKYAASLGMKALKMSKFEAAFHISDIKKHFLKSAELDPQQLDARWGLLRLYLELPGILGGSHAKAQDIAEQLMTINEGDGWLAKGYIAEYREKPKMKTYYTKAIAKESPQYCFKKLSGLYDVTFDTSTAVFKHAQEIFSQFDENSFNYLLADYGFKNNIQLEKSIVLLKSFIENYSQKDDNSLAYAYLRLAQIHKKLGKKSRAQHWIDKAVSLKENFALAKKTQSQLSMM